MTSSPRPRLAAWSGWVMVPVFAIAPLMAWLGPRGFASLAAIAGLLALPNFRVRDEDRPAGIAILVLVIWALGSMVWSPYTPRNLGAATGLKLAAEAVLLPSAIAAARGAPAASRVWMLRAFAWGMALLGLILMAEAATGAGIYRALRDALHDPIRPDLGVKNVAQALFVLALFTPAAAVAGARVGGGAWLALPMIVGVAWPSIVFSYDAPLLALVLSAIAMALVYGAPRWGPRLMATAAVIFFMFAPVVVWGVRKAGLWEPMAAKVSLSWSQRMGYWAHAQDWIADHPLRGWGLDASRMFGPGIHLHPHDAALQVWLELGLIGAASAAVLWAVILAGLGRDRRDLALAASAGCAAAYLTFNAFSFGVWQEWWVSLGGLACAACAALLRQPPRAKA